MVLVYDGSSDDGTGIWQIFQRACCYHPVHGGGVVSGVLAFLMLFNLVLPWCCESFAWDQRYMSFLIHSPTILSLTQRRQKETSLHCCPKLTEIWNIDSKSFTFSIKVSAIIKGSIKSSHRVLKGFRLLTLKWMSGLKKSCFFSFPF